MKTIRSLIEASDSVEEVLNSIDTPEPTPTDKDDSENCDDPISCLNQASSLLRRAATYCNSNDDTFQDKKIGTDANTLAHTVEKLGVRLGKEMNQEPEEDLSDDIDNDGDDLSYEDDKPSGYSPEFNDEE